MNNAWHEYNDKVSGFSSNYWYSQKMEGRANDNFTSGVNGRASGTWMGITSSNHYGCSVFHEYSHNVIYQAHGYWLGTNYEADGRAMDEGLSDYYSCSFRNNPIRYAVDRRLDTKMKYPGSGGAHTRGQIIGGACWDLGSKSGMSLNYVNGLVYESVTNIGYEETFGDFMDEMLSADDNDGNIFNGTPHDDQIFDAFVNDHAIVGSYLAGYISENITINRNTVLIGNVYVTSGKTLTIQNGITVNLNGYYIVSTGGTISVQSGVTINNCAYLKEGSVVKGLFSNLQSALSFSSVNQQIEISGSISHSGSSTVNSNCIVKVNSGATLTVNPSSTISFSSGVYIDVYGTLISNGASGQITFNSAGSSKWGGIKLQSTASANSVIKYCNISNANQGIYVGLTPIYPSNFPTIENNTITNCNDGIYLYDSEGGSSKPLRFNTITNSLNGIRFEGFASFPNYVWITDNIVRYNDVGIVMRNAHPRLFRNKVTCNNDGVRVENWSYPKFAETQRGASGYNRFADNFIINLSVNNFVNVWMGQINEVDEGQYGGDNTLGSYEDIQNPWNSFIAATNQSLVMANYSYFGSYPPVSWKIYRDGTSSIDYSAYLNWDPVPDQSCSYLSAGKSNNNENEMSLELNNLSNKETVKPRIGGFATKGVKKNIPTLLLYFGMHHYLANKLDAASRVFYQIINTYPDSSESIFALNLLTRMLYESKVDTIYNFISKFESRFGQNPNKNSYALYKASLPILAGALIRQNNIPNALSVYDKIIERFPQSENAKYSIYSKLAYYVNIENNLSMASILYNQLESQFPNDPLLVDALILLGDDPSPMLAKVKINKRQNFQKKNEVQKSDVDNLTIEDFSLEQNYPNPFNPSTIIQYQIPIAGNVKLKVFDLLGREVAELINQEQTEGVYRIIFGIDSGKKLSSGVYYYSIEVKGSDGRNYRNVKKMTILK